MWIVGWVVINLNKYKRYSYSYCLCILLKNTGNIFGNDPGRYGSDPGVCDLTSGTLLYVYSVVQMLKPAVMSGGDSV